jgi:hypothetical protein
MITASFDCRVLQSTGEGEVSIRWAIEVDASGMLSSYHETPSAIDERLLFNSLHIIAIILHFMFLVGRYDLSSPSF